MKPKHRMCSGPNQRKMDVPDDSKSSDTIELGGPKTWKCAVLPSKEEQGKVREFVKEEKQK